MDVEPQLCRLCLIPVDPNTVVILNQAVDLIDSILQITTVDVIVDSSRQVFLCDQCQNTLDVSIQFRMMCLQNDATFRKMYAKQALPLEGGGQECDNFAVGLASCKVEDTLEDNETFDTLETGTSFQDNQLQNDDQQSSSQEEEFETKLSNLFYMFETESQINEPEKDKQSPIKKAKVKKQRSKIKTESTTDHQDEQHNDEVSSKEKPKKARKKRIRPYKPPAIPPKRMKVQCQICGAFTSREHLSKHIQTHSDDRPLYACELCPKKYPHKKNLKEHIEIVHENTKEYVCKVCGKGFARKKRLDSHFNAIHTEEKKFACSACGEKFPTSGYRNYHFKVHHTNVRPYSCKYCPMTFKRSNDLTLHTRTHTGEKPYKCDLCDKRFAKSYNVVIHKKSHKNAELRLAAAQQKAENLEHNI